jgi:two-component system sensor histidine kinase YesM
MVTLSRRFSAGFILILALPSLLISVVLARLYLSALYQTVAQQAEATAEQVAQNLHGETDNVAILLAALLYDNDLRQSVEQCGEATNRRVRYQEGHRIDQKLTSFFNYTKEVGAVVLRAKNGARYSCSNYPNLRGLAGMDRSVVAGAAADPGKVFLFDTLDGVTTNIGEKNLVTLAVCPAPTDKTAIESILVCFRVPAFDGLAGQREASPDSAMVIFGRSGKPILCGVPGASPGELAALARLAASPGVASREGRVQEAPSPVGPSGNGRVREVRVGGRIWLTTLSPMDGTGWTVVMLTDKTSLARRLVKYQWYLYAALALLAILFVAYAEVFFARIAAPIRAMVGHMGRVGRGDYAVRASYETIAELAELSRGFNGMVQEVERLRVERERSERERVAAELDALRYQINPHFVANTLNSIRLMASVARADGIAGMTRDLMRILSDSYSGAAALAELARETDNAGAYIGIMKVRFGELLGIEFALDPGTEALLTLRMLLQPIVENAILHGFAGSGPARTSRGTIRVSARLEARELPPPPCPEAWAVPVPGQVLLIDVWDNGAGMDAERVARILDCGPEGGRSRIGVANVHRRIRLNFGAPYGLEVASEPGVFTRVRFVLPALIRAESEVSHA